MLQSSVAATCPMTFNKLNPVRHVAGANFAQISCCASEKVPAHTRGCVAVTCPWNMSPQCILNTILSPLHFAATCSCNMSPSSDHEPIRSSDPIISNHPTTCNDPIGLSDLTASNEPICSRDLIISNDFITSNDPISPNDLTASYRRKRHANYWTTRSSSLTNTPFTLTNHV